jgi:transcription elongation factor GreA-like protein
MTKRSAPPRHLPTSPFAAPVVPTIVDFALGDRVSHDHHGLGRIIGVEQGAALLVDFGSRQARIVSPYSGMEKL